MKQKSYHMKKSFFWRVAAVLLAVVGLSMSARAAETPMWGESHFEQSYNYMAYSLGQGRFHFKTLIFAEGWWNNYNANRGHYGLGDDWSDYPNVWYQPSGGSKTKIVEYYADNYYNKPGKVDGRPRNKGWVKLKVDKGTVVVTNTYDGNHITFTADGQWHEVDILRADAGDHLTFLEVDWYPPASLTGTFTAGVYSSRLSANDVSDDWEDDEFDLGSFTFGTDVDQQPELMDPVFYPSTEVAPGYMAVPYLSYQETYQYNTSLNPTTNMPLHERSGILYVPAIDSVQHGFYINVETRKSSSSSDVVFKQWLKSTHVNIPAYHRIYNMEVQPYKWHDTVANLWLEDNRYRDITWQMKYPHEEDAVDFDYIEIQRAYRPDFSDAVTIANIDMDLWQRDSADWKTFHYVDSLRAAWMNPTYPAGSDSSYMIFYRMRRVSSALWGWEGNPYAVSDTSMQQVYLLGLSGSNSWFRYTTDADFDENHKVHLDFRINPAYNGLMSGISENLPRELRVFWDDKAEMKVQRIATETHDTVTFTIPDDSIQAFLHRLYTSAEYWYGNYDLAYTDQLHLHCVHYQYRVYLDTVGSTLKLYANYEPTSPADTWSMSRNGGIDPYFTDAATLTTLEATNDLSDCILLHWDVAEGGVDEYTVERRYYTEMGIYPWISLGSTTDGYWRDTTVAPASQMQYRVTAVYTCNGTRMTSSRSALGLRSQYGSVSGAVRYEDGTGCAGVTLTATVTQVHSQSSSQPLIPGTVVQTVTTDASGHYLFDSLLYAAGYDYAISPAAANAEFRYNYTTSPSASVNLSLGHCIVTGIDFENISSVRFSSRVLYENSSIPVRDAHILLNGNVVSHNQAAVVTDATGNFEIRVPQNEGFTLQIVKEGHHFLGDGFVRMNGDSVLTLQTALDGVRVWDQTKVRLAGRLCGGLDQRDLPVGFGLSHNNLGENLQMVLELEGDNVSYIVRVPSDLTKDTLEYRVPHLVYHQNGGTDTVGWTKVLYQQRRIVIEPDSATGEYCADLFPVRYKVTQATAQGYSTLFPAGTSTPVVDLSAAASHEDTITHNSKFTIRNSQFTVAYRSPISITCRQMRWGMEVDWLGEKEMRRTNLLDEEVMVPLATKQSDGTYHYTFGVPVFKSGTYDFCAYAHEDYYWNNNPSSHKHDQVHIRGGLLKVYNGMHNSAGTPTLTKQLDTNGTATFSVPVDYASFTRTDSNVIRMLDLSVESEGQYVVSQAVRGYVMGNQNPGNITTTHGKIQLLDILRDPPGSASNAYLEDGATYSYSYVYDLKVKFGLSIGLTVGNETKFVMGAYQGSQAGGQWGGTVNNISTAVSSSLPITSSFNYKHQGTYSFKTAERISTSTNNRYVGQDADVYIGAVQNVYTRRWDAVQPIDSLSYAAFGARSANGTMPMVASGADTAGHPYYIVIGQEIEGGTYMDATFAYTHYYIKTTIIPQLKAQRDALLLTCDSLSARAAADSTHEVVYWSKVPVGDSNWACEDYYLPMVPANFTADWTDQVDHFNGLIADWFLIMLENEREKIQAIHTPDRDSIATYSLGTYSSLSHDEEYTYSDAYHVFWDLPGASPSISDGLVKTIGKAGGLAIIQRIKKVTKSTHENGASVTKPNPRKVICKSFHSVTELDITPILNVDFSRDPTESTTHTRKIGYKLQPDDLSHIDVAVYRARRPYWFNDSSDATRDHVEDGNDYDGDDYLYGSPVYYLLGGATKCPCELPDSTEYYEPKMPISAGSLRLENPKIDINVHERSDVPVDRPALFTIYLSNEIEEPIGVAASRDIDFKLRLNESSNPHGARIYIDGTPLSDGRIIKLTGRQIITKTVEVYAGDGYDFEDLILEYVSTCYAPTKGRVKFSVHFMPVSTPVDLEIPHQNWVLNTLSPQDSVGYYLPVTISGYDVNYREFDHIELQYKLSTQGDDGWVNLCSYYYDSALYLAASGTKAMFSGGRIDNIRFYGERDPMEQRYDIRAVSFCRHGSSFVTRASEVMSGIKDTRRPRLFGQPLPANGVLGVGDDLKLRFNEPIAGNYLDEDNNFQLLGSTNTTGIASGTSIFFDGTPSCGAASAVTRVLDGKSFSVDLMVKPSPNTSPNSQELLGHSTPTGGISFGLQPDGNSYRLYATIDDYSVQSLPLQPITDFTRVIMTYDDSTGCIRFYNGNLDVTDPAFDTTGADGYRGEAPLVFGHGYKGNMLEARLWFKVLSQAEINETNRKRLTGFERKLAAYYPMNEGRGETLKDKANGGTLTLHGSSWTTPSGYSLHLDGNTAVKLDQNLLSRLNIQDYTLMFWFRTSEYYAGLFSAGWTGTSGTLIALENGQLVFKNGGNSSILTQRSSLNYADGLWHHYVISVNRTYNNASIYVDGALVNTVPSDSLSGLSGEMYLGGVQSSELGVQSFIGHLDGFALFEQALPKSLIESYDNLSPKGDELGLIAWLPFNEQRENDNGIMEEVFSVYNQRTVRRNGEDYKPVQKLVLWPSEDSLARMADGNVRAPIRERDLVTKMNFDWAFNNDELLINLNMADNEINKNSIYITVRNVEDLNGNRTVSPTTWQVFVNKNTLLWESDGIDEMFYYGSVNNQYTIPVRIRNNSGRRHQFTIEGLPDWLTVDRPQGSIEPQESLTLNFSIDGRTLAVGSYSELIYLTDEDDLSEPLKVHIEMKATCPWYGVQSAELDRQMSLRAQVKIDGRFMTNPEDVLVAFVDDSLVGFANVTPDVSGGGGSYVYMTIYGNAQTEGKALKFRTWQASTGRIYNLTSDESVSFHADGLVGLPPSTPLQLYSTSTAVQYFDLYHGWNWVSLAIAPDNDGSLSDLFFMNETFSVGDQIKEAYSRRFAEWDGHRWRGTLTKIDYRQVYMIYTEDAHYDVQVAGQRLTTAQQRTLTLKHDWNSLPYLQMTPSSVTEAMADYVDHAIVGDLVKSQDAFAVFSENQRWEGSLTAMYPGEGYLMKRLGVGDVQFTYHVTRNNKGGKKEELRTKNYAAAGESTAQSTMTMIAATEIPVDRVLAYVNGKLVATAEPIDSLFFITIPADETGVVTFALETSTSGIHNSQFTIHNSPDAHYGTLEQPVMLSLATDASAAVTAYPTVFTDQVTFYVNEELRIKNEESSITLTDALGRKVLQQEITLNSYLLTLNLKNLPSGVYFATVKFNDNVTTIKLIKK